MVTRITLSEDVQEQLDRKLHMIQPGDKVTATYFRLERVIAGLELGSYITETGEAEEIDPLTGILFLSTACVPIPEIIEIKCEALDYDYMEADAYAGPD